MKVKVWNDNVHEFKQKFRDEVVKIPARGFVELDEDYAHNFVCQYYPPEVDAAGVQKPTSFKMLRIERDGEVTNRLDPYLCIACGYKGASKKDLEAHVEARLGDGKHVRLEEDQKLSADEIIGSLSPEILEKLTEKLSEKLASQIAPKKPGRPKKEEVNT